MILQKNGLAKKLRAEISRLSFEVKKVPERDVGSPLLPETKTSSVFAGEANLTVVASVCVATRIYWLLKEKLPLVHSPRERNSRVNRTARAASFFFTRDIKNRIKFQPSIARWNIKRSAAVTETFHRNVTFSHGDKVVHARVVSYECEALVRQDREAPLEHVHYSVSGDLPEANLMGSW